MNVLHRTTDLRPIASIEAGTWIWDDRNDEPALFHGWSNYQGCYIAEWQTDGDFCLFAEEFGRPTMLEVLRVEVTEDDV